MYSGIITITKKSNIRRRRARIIPFVPPNPQLVRTKAERLHLHAKKKKCIARVHKSVWTAAVLLSASLCTWQLATCIAKYFTQPIGTNVRVETLKHYTLPGLTLCPTIIPITYDFQQQFDKQCTENFDCEPLSDNEKKQFPFNEMGFTLLDLWNQNSNVKIDTFANCVTAVDAEECNSTRWMQRGLVDTTAGPCHTFKTSLKWHFLSKMWVFWIEIRNILDMSGAVFSVDLFTTTSPNLMFMGKAFIVKDWDNELEISTTKFEYLNTTRKPCITEEEAIQCTRKWFVQSLKRQDIKCRWPFMNSTTLPLCNSMVEVDKVNERILQLQMSPKTRNRCKRPCVSTAYSVIRLTDYIEDARIATFITLTSRPTQQIVQEYCTYPLSSLVSEVGGSIGLFLGISLLSCLKFLRQSLQKLHKTFNP